MSDGQGNGNGLADTIAPFQIVISYHPITHQLGAQLPQCDDIIILGMLECAKAALAQARQQKTSGIVAPNFMMKPGARLT
jgi:hypothetical protein